MPEKHTYLCEYCRENVAQYDARVIDQEKNILVCPNCWAKLKEKS